MDEATQQQFDEMFVEKRWISLSLSLPLFSPSIYFNNLCHEIFNVERKNTQSNKIFRLM
jgi:hypothetical protein